MCIVTGIHHAYMSHSYVTCLHECLRVREFVLFGMSAIVLLCILPPPPLVCSKSSDSFVWPHYFPRIFKTNAERRAWESQRHVAKVVRLAAFADADARVLCSVRPTTRDPQPT